MPPLMNLCSVRDLRVEAQVIPITSISATIKHTRDAIVTVSV